MSSALEELRAAAKKRRRVGVCAFCAEAEVEVTVSVSMRERGTNGAYLRTRTVSACAPCALTAMARFLNPNGGTA